MKVPKLYNCPACSSAVEAKADYLARGLKCPNCQTGFMPEYIHEKRKPFPTAAAIYLLAIILLVALLKVAGIVAIGGVFACVAIVGAIVLYFLPSIIGRDKRNANAIIVMNILLGWTFIGWAVAMIWAVTKDHERA